MNCLRPLQHWDREFESHWRHSCLCAFILFVLSCVYVAALPRADPSSKESDRLYIRIVNWKKRSIPNKNNNNEENKEKKEEEEEEEEEEES
jgi:hypothetical protein